MDVAEIITRVPIWAGREPAWQRLEGGLSHHIYRVDVGTSADSESFVLRVLDPAVSAAGLGVEPAQEIANTVRAAATGVGPRVLDVLADVPAVVLEFVPGRTLCSDDVRRPENLGPIAAACRHLHAGAPFDNAFDIFAKRAELLDVCARHDLPLPPGYLDHNEIVDRIRAALAVRPLPLVPCHNDLLAENFIKQEAVRIVDYQLSGNNDPAFELGDIAAESDFDPDLVALLTEAYFGEHSAALLARVRLYLLASNVTWTLWFTIHDGLLRGQSVFDYHAEAADKWGQAQRSLADPTLGALLDAVR
jgi:thiamine kinase-like enzyme